MIELIELRQKLLNTADDLKNIEEALDIKGAREEVIDLEEKTADPNFYSDIEQSSKVLKQISDLKNKISNFEALSSLYEDTITLIEIAVEEDDAEYLEECKSSANSFFSRLDQLNLETLLNGEYDKNNAIMAFHSGAGGTEAQDWVEMLYRMYSKYSTKKDFKFKVLDYLDGDEAGIKSATVLVEGYNAYGFLKSEAGVHRLVRISPFDSSGRRHTSFASVEVLPEISDDTVVEINPEDLRIDTFRAGGAGGQHVNKTESAVRVTHLPTGIVVACQNERSQHQNRDVAMKMLKSKLIEIKEREHLDKIEDIKGEQQQIAWGSQIRSYVFMPYTLAKDHRTSFESGNINAVMDGEIDGFINEYLKQQSLK